MYNHKKEDVNKVKPFKTQYVYLAINKGNNKITELRAILQRESKNS